MARLKNSVRAPGAPLKKIPPRVAEAIALYARVYQPGAPMATNPAFDRHQLLMYLESFSVKETDAYYDGLIELRKVWAAARVEQEPLPDPGLEWDF